MITGSLIGRGDEGDIVCPEHVLVTGIRTL
jgi:hypothetical protein